MTHTGRPRRGHRSLLLLDKLTAPELARCAISLVKKLRSSYMGPAFIARRADNVELDIGFDGVFVDIAALLAFAGSNSVYLKQACDQGLWANHLSAPSNAAQPRIVNNGTLETHPGGKQVAVFNGINNELSRPDALGLTGSPALTVGCCWSGQSDQKMPWILGSLNGAADTHIGLYADYNASGGHDVLVLMHQSGPTAKNFTTTPVSGFHSYTYRRPANVGGIDGSLMLRQDGAACAFHSNTGPNTALNLSNQYTALGRAVWAFSAVKENFFTVINAELTGAELAAFDDEQAAHA